MSDRPGELLPGGRPLRFSEIESALNASRDAGGGRGVTATVVAVGPAARLAPAASAFAEIADATGIRAILISNGTDAEPQVHIASYAVAIEGLLPRYLNNAVAAVRLPSLPMLVWWRGGAPGALDGVAELADRLVLDTEDPVRVWVRAASLAEQTALSDLRWTALTRWRTVLAHFFDITEVRAATSAFDTLQIEAGDMHGARLLAGWLASSLRWDRRVTIDLRDVDGGAMQLVRLSGGGTELTLRLVAEGKCIEASASCRGCSSATQIVPLGDQSLAGLLAEELRVRSRDVAFERALRAMEDVA